MKNEYTIAIMAAIEAGRLIEKIYHSKNFELEFKSDDSPITKADKEANTIIDSFLKKTLIPIISEENKAIEYDLRKKWKNCWIVDPLDGTKEFVKKNGEFTVNIALVSDNKPLFGVIFSPITKELYYACVDEKKAYKRNIGKSLGNTINWFDDSFLVATELRDYSKLKVLVSRSHMNEETTSFLHELKNKYPVIDIIPMGSSYKFCFMAEGKADIYARFAPTMEWDTAAGQAICDATGVKVISKNTFKKLKYNKRSLLNDSFLIVNSRIPIVKEWMKK